MKSELRNPPLPWFLSRKIQDCDIRMVPTPFTWRYGGHQVFLSGSFNGWNPRIQMFLIKGSETIFQIIIDLPPGRYQYKFLVDGTWRVDQQKICDVDEYGTINNVVLVNGTELTSQDLNAESFQPSTSGNIEVNTFVGSALGVPPLNQSIVQLPDDQVDVFRQVISSYLSSSTAYDLIPNSGKVFGLDVDVHVEEAFHLMYELGITVVPLWDEQRGQMVGMLTASDFILILLQLHRNHATFANVEHEIRTIFSWKDRKLLFHEDTIGAPLHRKPLINAGPDESLREVASKILQNNISSVPIIHAMSSSCSPLLHVVCLGDILRNICRHFRNHLGYLPLLQQPIGVLPIGSWAIKVRGTSGIPLLTLHYSEPLSSALIILLKAQISSIPIVDEGDKIMNVYSRSNITSLARDNIYTRIQLDQMTVSQALNLEVGNVTGRNGYQTCTKFDSLYRVMELLCEPDMRRVVVVEASTNHVEGIITLRDIFNFLNI